MYAYRIGVREHPLLDGHGAAASEDARWNGRGRYVIYAAEHYATALIEKAAQLGALRFPRTLAFIRIEIPDDATAERPDTADLPGWDADDKTASRAFGNRWYDERRSLILLVPSLVAPGPERNVLINQRHPEFSRVTGSRPEALIVHPKLRA